MEFDGTITRLLDEHITRTSTIVCSEGSTSSS
eukprot:CAMPEP_0198148198 /NCGR_PEP_ID=MMETSP1443-20131203/40388_1 /TAXON_ID=186043 /ORGANISM="Entomoneis sp., Strain CCMP2396" /LENGTH=31 /DNA_ID= /DNA_START= /DNA_END= /DNA_ORIENTATION=